MSVLRLNSSPFESTFNTAFPIGFPSRSLRVARIEAPLGSKVIVASGVVFIKAFITPYCLASEYSVSNGPYISKSLS